MKVVTGLVLYLLIAIAAAVVAAPATSASSSSPRLVEQSQFDRHAHAIAERLRCLVCQGESVADSGSEFAADVRAQIEDKLALGWSDERIIQYFVARYGEFILYRPELQTTTWVLWFGPLFMLIPALAWLLMHLRRRAQRRPPDALSPQEAERVRVLLGPRQEDEP